MVQYCPFCDNYLEGEDRKICPKCGNVLPNNLKKSDNNNKQFDLDYLLYKLSNSIHNITKDEVKIFIYWSIIIIGLISLVVVNFVSDSNTNVIDTTSDDSNYYIVNSTANYTDDFNDSGLALDENSTTDNDSGGNVTFIASSNSNKFHDPSCTAVSRIKDANKITFNSRQEAIDAGYEPCGICNP